MIEDRVSESQFKLAKECSAFLSLNSEGGLICYL